MPQGEIGNLRVKGDSNMAYYWEAAVVGHEDTDELVKPKAFVVLKDGHAATPGLEDELNTSSRTSSRPTSTRAGSSSFPHFRRQRQARSSASSCADSQSWPASPGRLPGLPCHSSGVAGGA